MSISTGNTKMGKIPSWSLRPGEDCTNSELCGVKCYAKKAYRQYPVTRRALTNNRKAVDDGTWIEEVSNFLTRKAPKLFRVHVSGDFVTREYAKQWASIARRFPRTKFLAFTKSFKEVGGIAWPSNFAIVRSAFPGMRVAGRSPIAFAGEPEEYTGKMRERAKNAFVCRKKCTDCGWCWSLHKSRKDVRLPWH